MEANARKYKFDWFLLNNLQALCLMACTTYKPWFWTTKTVCNIWKNVFIETNDLVAEKYIEESAVKCLHFKINCIMLIIKSFFTVNKIYKIIVGQITLNIYFQQQKIMTVSKLIFCNDRFYVVLFHFSKFVVKKKLFTLELKHNNIALFIIFSNGIFSHFGIQEC